MFAYGMLAGLGLLVAVALLDAARHALPVRTGLESDISDQAWQVLAEARRIVEEGARGL
jgi:hypothetical protein